MQAQGRQLELGIEGPAIERLDIDQFMLETKGARIDPVLRQGIKHERVVRIRRMADANELGGGLCGHAMSCVVSGWWKPIFSPASKSGNRPAAPCHRAYRKLAVSLTVDCVSGAFVAARGRRPKMPIE